ncbi:hypothetical protein [Arhodomonas sp. AD133]|uniref:hypothetical protein n=1 Tax=Arhodomonas sp. AD133 TaxID=3415009 RepID=UPI003EB9EA1C
MIKERLLAVLVVVVNFSVVDAAELKGKVLGANGEPVQAGVVVAQVGRPYFPDANTEWKILWEGVSDNRGGFFVNTEDSEASQIAILVDNGRPDEFVVRYAVARVDNSITVSQREPIERTEGNRSFKIRVYSQGEEIDYSNNLNTVVLFGVDDGNSSYGLKFMEVMYHMTDKYSVYGWPNGSYRYFASLWVEEDDQYHVGSGVVTVDEGTDFVKIEIP